MSYIDTKIISLTSQTATVKKNGSYLSNVRYELANILKDDPDIIHSQIQLLHAQIPYSFYVINYTNNLFKCDLGYGITTYTIPVGNYNANSLLTAIMSVIGDPTFTVVLSNITGKIQFSYTENFYIYNNFKYSIGSVLGFEQNSINFSAGINLTCPYPLNILGIKNLQIRSTVLNMNNISSLNGGQTILLSTIPVSCVPFGMIDFYDTGNNLISITNTSLDEIDLEILDGESGEFINFNNQDWCMTIAIHSTKLIEPKPKSTFTTLRQEANNIKQPSITDGTVNIKENTTNQETINQETTNQETNNKENFDFGINKQPLLKVNQKDLEEFNLLNQ
jgi:hypothetical protein